MDSVVGRTAARAYMSVCTGLSVVALHIMVPVPLAACLFQPELKASSFSREAWASPMSFSGQVGLQQAGRGVFL